MTTLLTFGDSNTYGSSPVDEAGNSFRYAPEVRWPTRVCAELGWDLVEGGLPGRTAATPDPEVSGVHMDGRLGLAIALQSCGPIDFMTLMLGTNDVKARFNLNAAKIADHIEGLIKTTLSEDMQIRHDGFQILLIAPPPVREMGTLADIYAGAEPASNTLAALLREVAERHGVNFLDAGDFINVSEIDGVHYAPEMHGKLARPIANCLKNAQAPRHH